MLNKNERMEMLNKKGVDTSKYFTLDVNESIPAGAKIHVVIDKNGDAVMVENDAILNQIVEDGYVRNTKLHRRFVMAQMFHMLNYKSYSGEYEGYNDCLKIRYEYDYTFKMMLEEVRVLSKLEDRDRETFLEREHFFDRATVATVVEDYIEELKAYVETLPIKKCKGVPYKKVKKNNIFVADLDKKLYAPVRSYANRIRVAKDYKAVYRILKEFMSKMVKLPYDTPKSKVWIDAYKGEGAYYTLKNLVMFHECGIESGDYFYEGTNAVKILKSKLEEYKGEGWRMFALMKKVIKDNNFNFDKRMEEIYNK